MTWVTFHHLVGWLKASIGDFSNRKLLMVGLLSRDDWSVGSQREVDTWVGHQVGLELSKIHIQGTIKTQGSSDGAHNLANQPEIEQNQCNLKFEHYSSLATTWSLYQTVGSLLSTYSDLFTITFPFSRRDTNINRTH